MPGALTSLKLALSALHRLGGRTRPLVGPSQPQRWFSGPGLCTAPGVSVEVVSFHAANRYARPAFFACPSAPVMTVGPEICTE